jgi:hypothetical protein
MCPLTDTFVPCRDVIKKYIMPSTMRGLTPGSTVRQAVFPLVRRVLQSCYAMALSQRGALRYVGV